MKFKIKKMGFYLLLGGFLFSSCKEYLDEKPLKSLVVPSTMEDLEALLNARWIVENSSAVNEIVADDYYIDIADWNYLMSQSANIPYYLGDCLSYYWDAKAMQKSWKDSYKNPIYYSNVVLEVARKIRTNDQIRLNRIIGSALFHRSFAFERLAQVYCKPYSLTSSEDLGLVLRMTSDINEPTKRSTVQETYFQIIKDLKEAAELLPSESEFPTEPSKAAAYGTLARVYLSMRDYSSAGYYADLCLKINNSLMDYNDIDMNNTPIFKEYNKEVIFHSQPIPPGILAESRAKINNELYQLYEEGDLRKRLFFLKNTGANNNTYRFRGSYLGRFGTGSQVFHGITTGEMFLIRAESFARNNNKEAALMDLNTLGMKRWMNNGSWTPTITANADEALQVILQERRRELIMRGLRWTDLRRLNEEGANITLTRILGGITYTLPPGDLRWTLLIPEEVIERSSIAQNPR